MIINYSKDKVQKVYPRLTYLVKAQALVQNKQINQIMEDNQGWQKLNKTI